MKYFTNLSTQAKLILSFGLIMILFLVVITISYRDMQSISQSERNLNDDHFRKALLLRDLRSHQNFNRGVVLEMMLTSDKSDQLALEKLLNERTDSVHKAIETLSANNDDQQFQAQLKNLKTELAAYLEGRDAEIVLIKAGKVVEAQKMAILTQKDHFDNIRTLSMQMGNQATLEANAQLILDEKQADNSSLLIVLLGIAALLFSIGIVVLMNQTIAQPLNGLTGMASKIASGDLNVKITTVERKDEIGKLSKAFGMMVEYLRQFVNEINEGVNTLASASTEILAATTQVATGTAETATAISETSATVEEVQQASKQSSLIAKNVADSAQRVAQVSQSGQKAVDETISGMNKIREQMDSIAQTVVRLSEQSQSIGGIIVSVTDIADQSNLLAVNAAIEAAKAGEQGKGFAVVAQEIKNLAGQSKQSTLEVRNILNDIQKATTAAVLATEQGSNAVSAGLKQSMLAGDSIKVLAESSNEAAQSAAQIVASSQQQVIGMDQIGVAMNNINQAGTETAVSMVQAEKSARNLYELGQKLKQQAEKFNT